MGLDAAEDASEMLERLIAVLSGVPAQDQSHRRCADHDRYACDGLDLLLRRGFIACAHACYRYARE